MCYGVIYNMSGTIRYPNINWGKDLGNCSKCDKTLLKTKPYFSKTGYKGRVKRYCLFCAEELNLI